MNSMKKYIIVLLVVSFVLTPSVASAATIEELQSQIQRLLAQIQVLQEQIAQQKTRAFCYDFNTNLRFGDRGSEVKALYEAFVKEGGLIRGTANPDASFEFDEAIASAVVGFQQKYASEILAPFGLKFGTRFVGKGTRAKLNALYGCGVIQPPVPIPTPTPIPLPVPSPISPSITVTSPNGGETWTKGTTQTIKWQDNMSEILLCQIIGSTCVPSAQKYYDINLVTYYPPCTGNVCPLYAYEVPRAIAKGVSGSSYAWTIPNCTAGNECSSNFNIGAGSYTIQICQTGSSACDSSDSYFKIVGGSPDKNNPPTISGVSGPRVLKVGEVGKWEVKASDPEQGQLTYSVNWGDETVSSIINERMVSSAPGIATQTATFTHIYSKAVVYAPTFTVTDNGGLSAKTSINVSVSTQPSITADVKVNNSDFPLSVAYDSPFTVSWTSTGAVSCVAYGMFIPLVEGGLWSDSRNLSVAGTKTLYARHNTFGYYSPLEIGVQCSDASGNSKTDAIYLSVLAPPVVVQPSPTVTTSGATNITSTSGSLNGNVNANGGSVDSTGLYGSWFRYGTTNPGVCSNTFGARAPAIGAFAGTGLMSQTITGLASDTTYYFCIVGANTTGTSYGNVLSFTTSADIARDSRRRVDIAQILTAHELYYSDNIKYITSASMPPMTGYLAIIPKDPVTGNAYGWVNNSSNAQDYCVYANLDKASPISGNKILFVGGPRGTTTIDVANTFIPTLTNCE